MTNHRVPDVSRVSSPPRRSLDYHRLDTDDDPIGTGGQAVVYKATLTGNDPPDKVALKEPVVGPETLPPESVGAFLNEATTWETVDGREREKYRWQDSEHIVGVVDTGDDLPWIAMEFMDGGGLDDRLDVHSDGLPIDEVLWTGECVCRGVELAHNYGIAHLDLKPANLLFRETEGDAYDVPKIADWGLARVLAARTGTMEGLSVKYAAPEQFEPDEFGDPDMLTDIYQIGALVYAMLTGDPPYAGSQLSVMRDVVTPETPPPPSSQRNEIPETVDAAVLAALEPDKRDRYDSIQVFKQALHAIRNIQRPPQIITNRLDSTDSVSGTGSAETSADGPTATQTGINSSASATRGETQEENPTTVSTATEKWPMFQGGPQRNGVSSTTGPQHSVTTRWTFHPDAWVHSPVVSGDTVYVGGEHTVYAIEAGYGTQRWSFQTDGSIRSAPAVADGTIYVGSLDNTVYARNEVEGTERWQFQTDGPVRSSPVVADGTVYFGSHDNTVYALETAGSLQWSLSTEGSVRSSPAVAGNTVYVGSNDGNVYALDATDGTPNWIFQTDGRVPSSPAVVDGTVYVGSLDNTVYGIDATDGTERWAFETNGSIWSSPAVADGTVYVGSNDRNIYALDATEGTEQWKFHTNDSIRSSPAVADNTVYIGSNDRNIYALDASQGTEHWRFGTDGLVVSSPAVADDTVYIGSRDRTVYALSEPEEAES